MLCLRSVRHWCGKAGVDDRRRDLIPVLRLAFGLYLQRRELDKGESFGFSTRLRPDTKRRTSANLPSCVFAAEFAEAPTWWEVLDESPCVARQ